MPKIEGKLAAKIRAAIKADNRTIYALALESGTSRKQLGLFMRGESDMTLTIAARLCEVLGLELVEKE
jgi:predicted transcriptional regulator